MEMFQTYIYDLDALSDEVENIVLSSPGIPISAQVKRDLLRKFTPVLRRMPRIQQYAAEHPDFEHKSECFKAYSRLSTRMEALWDHDSTAEQI
jgi:hypothetical protein